MAYAGKTSDQRRASSISNLKPAQTLAPAVSGRRGTIPLATGVAIGLVIGVGAALLLAPQSGAETRHALRRGVRRVGRRGRSAWDDLRDELRRARLELKRSRRRTRLARMERWEADEPEVVAT